MDSLSQQQYVLIVRECPKTFFPYNMISFYITSAEYAKFVLCFVFDSPNKLPIRINLPLPNRTSYSEIFSKLSKITQVSEQNIVMGLLEKNILIQYVYFLTNAKYLKEYAALLFCYESPAVSFELNKNLSDITIQEKDKTENVENNVDNNNADFARYKKI